MRTFMAKSGKQFTSKLARLVDVCVRVCVVGKKEGDEGISPFAQTPLCVSGENTLWLEQKKLLSIFNATYEPVFV